MAEAEAKLRKLGPVAFTTTDAIAAFGESLGSLDIDDATGKEKVRGASICFRCLPQPCQQRLSGFLHRHGNDIVGVGGYLAFSLVGHLMAFHMMQPADALAIRVLRPAFIVASCLFNLSWCGIIYHGPGRPPPEDSSGGAEQRDLLVKGSSTELAAVMRVGRLCHSRPFGPEDGHCARCNRRKHPLVHHCSKCDQCTIWMDHHCKLCAQCIGFRNFRCFIVWLLHGTLLYWCLVLLTLHRLYCEGWPRDLWFLAWAPWFCYIAAIAKQISAHLQQAVLQLAGGWHGRVVRQKFEAVFAESKQLQGKLHMLLDGMLRENPAYEELAAAAEALAEAAEGLRSGVTLPFESKSDSKLLWGPFLGRGFDPLRAVFGAPFSWRWLLPGVPGGRGNPFEPEVYSERGCKVWAALEAAMEKGQEVYQQNLLAQRDQQERLRALLAGVDQQGPAEA